MPAPMQTIHTDKRFIKYVSTGIWENIIWYQVASADVQVQRSETNEENVLSLMNTNPIPYKVMSSKLRKPKLTKHNLISL
jgi:hypothetical protein